MSPLIETVLFVFGLVAAGYVSGLTGYLKPEIGESVAEFAVSVALPLLLFRTMLGADFSGASPWGLWGVYFSAVIVTWTAGHFLVTRGMARDARAGVVGGVTSAFSNLVLLGVPFMLGVFGQAGFEVLSVLVTVHLPTMMAASILLFEWAGRGIGEPKPLSALFKTFLRRLVTNPLIIGIVAGLLFRQTGLPLPALATRLVDSLANVAGPVALFAMGLGLRRFGIGGNVKGGLMLAGLKLVLMPALVLAFAWIADLPPLTAMVAVAAASLPAGVNSYLIATQFGTGQALASNAMTIGTAAAAVTTALWLSVAHIVFG